jgi:hypothetical protein
MSMSWDTGLRTSADRAAYSRAGYAVADGQATREDRQTDVYAMALGRAATGSYQRCKAREPSGIGIISAAVAKATATRTVMSAAESRLQPRRDIKAGLEVRLEIGNAALDAFDQLGNLVIVVRTR